MFDPKGSDDNSLKMIENSPPSISFHIQETASLITPERLDGTNYVENYLVKSWLLDAMTKDTRSLFLRLGTAKEI